MVRELTFRDPLRATPLRETTAEWATAVDTEADILLRADTGLLRVDMEDTLPREATTLSSSSPYMSSNSLRSMAVLEDAVPDGK